MGSIYNNPELEMVAKEIQTILMERLQIEKQIIFHCSMAHKQALVVHILLLLFDLIGYTIYMILR